MLNRFSAARWVAVLSLSLTPPIPSPAGVFKCLSDAGVLYQAQPCRGTGAPIELREDRPDEQDRALLRERIEREQQLVGEFDAERERAHRQADRARKAREKARAALEARCARYEGRIKQAARLARAGRKTSPDRLSEARARYFSECLGRR